jgi:hypothetical protein
LRLNFEAFRNRISSVVGDLEAHVFSTASEGAKQRQSDYFYYAGFAPHIEPIRTVQTYHGSRKMANSDNQLLLGLADRVSALRPSVVILATGDGDLGCAVSQFLANRSTPTQFHIASIRNWTSKRLYSRNNATVAGNIWLGQDLMQPVGEHFARV